jgi:excisionase family DNA binding protein
MSALDEIMGVDEASEAWGLNRDYIKQLCNKGKIEAVKIGNSWVMLKNTQNPSQPEHPKNWRTKKDHSE